MTDIQVSDCCGAAFDRVDQKLACRKCGEECGWTWEVIIWDEQPERG